MSSRDRDEKNVGQELIDLHLSLDLDSYELRAHASENQTETTPSDLSDRPQKQIA